MYVRYGGIYELITYIRMFIYDRFVEYIKFNVIYLCTYYVPMYLCTYVQFTAWKLSKGMKLAFHYIVEWKDRQWYYYDLNTLPSPLFILNCQFCFAAPSSLLFSFTFSMKTCIETTNAAETDNNGIIEERDRPLHTAPTRSRERLFYR